MQPTIICEFVPASACRTAAGHFHLPNDKEFLLDMDDSKSQPGVSTLSGRTPDTACNGDRSPPWNEADRLAALYSYAILDTGREAAFDDFTMMAANICGAPVAAISLIDKHRVWFKSEIGFGVDAKMLDASICAHAILGPDLFIVPDTTHDPRFRETRLMSGDLHLRFYAGVPLVSESGLPLGLLCVMDAEPRPTGLTAEQQRLLKALARQIMAQLELRRGLKIREQMQAELAISNARIEDVLECIPDAFYVLDKDWRVSFANKTARATWQLPPSAVIGRNFWDLFPGIADMEQSPGAALHRQVMRERQPGRTEFVAVSLSGQWCEITVYPISDGGISVYFKNVEARKQAEAALQTALAEKDLLMQEVHHRVKNNLQMIQNLLSLQARGYGDPQMASLLEQSSARINTIGLLHDRLYRGGSVTEVAIEPYLRGLIDDLAKSIGSTQNGRRIELDADFVVWPAREVPTLGLVLTELVTNALKHGAGTVSVRFHQPDSSLALLTVSDQGKDLPPDFDEAVSPGLGMRLILRLLRGRGGQFEVLRDRGHTCFRASLPLSLTLS